MTQQNDLRKTTINLHTDNKTLLKVTSIILTDAKTFDHPLKEIQSSSRHCTHKIIIGTT